MRTLQQCLSARDGSAPWRTIEKESTPNRERGVASILVDPRVTYQTMLGFGGAFTEAGAVTLQKLPAAKQEEIIQAYFGSEQGLGYTFCRTHINSCDFALGNYAYADKEGDFELTSFSIERDRTALIPFIKSVQKAAKRDLTIFASPWSPPAWMKTTGAMNQGGKLREDCRDAWARYYVRYIQEYAKEQISIWGLTVQNEPDSVQPWDSCLYSGGEERDFIRDHLGPALEKAGLGNVKILIWDHNRDLMYERAKAVLDDPAAARFVWGTAFHWYVTDTFDNVQRVHDAWPDKHLVFSEGCQEGGPHPGEWAVGERYARSMIQDLSHWTDGWVRLESAARRNGRPQSRREFMQRAHPRAHRPRAKFTISRVIISSATSANSFSPAPCACFPPARAITSNTSPFAIRMDASPWWSSIAPRRRCASSFATKAKRGRCPRRNAPSKR